MMQELIWDLTATERAQVFFMACGLSNTEIAALRGVTVKTVRDSNHHIFTALQVDSRVQVALYALRKGIVSISDAWGTVMAMQWGQMPPERRTHLTETTEPYLTDEAPQPHPLAHLSGQQRMVHHLCHAIGNDLDHSSNVAEQHTGALLKMVREIVVAGREAEAVALLRGWMREREGQS